MFLNRVISSLTGTKNLHVIGYIIQDSSNYSLCNTYDLTDNLTSTDAVQTERVI